MQYCYRIAWSSTLSLYVGIDIYNNAIYSSPDLTTWTSRATGILSMRGLYWFNNYFLVHTTIGNVYYSTDGINWNLLGQVSTQVVCMFNEPLGVKFFSTENINTSYLSDINISSPLNNQVLQYNSFKMD